MTSWLRVNHTTTLRVLRRWLLLGLAIGTLLTVVYIGASYWRTESPVSTAVLARSPDPSQLPWSFACNATTLGDGVYITASHCLESSQGLYLLYSNEGSICDDSVSSFFIASSSTFSLDGSDVSLVQRELYAGAWQEIAELDLVPMNFGSGYETAAIAYHDFGADWDFCFPRFMEVRSIPFDECNVELARYGFGAASSQVSCGWVEERLCGGASGAPLIWRGEPIGVVSAGDACRAMGGLVVFGLLPANIDP